jgi:hypothetical protein
MTNMPVMDQFTREIIEPLVPTIEQVIREAITADRKISKAELMHRLLSSSSSQTGGRDHGTE